LLNIFYNLSAKIKNYLGSFLSRKDTLQLIVVNQSYLRLGKLAPFLIDGQKQQAYFCRSNLSKTLHSLC